jgi:hypothetical protein
MKRELIFSYEKETPGTYRFKEDSPMPLVTTIYIKKSAFDTKPDKLKVTLEWEGK